jgi:hypothetical protein
MSLFKRKGRRFLGTASAVLCLAMSLVVFTPAARAGVCEGALSACLVDAGMTAVQNPVAGLIYAVFCMDGYLFCLHYYPEA